MNAEAVFLMQGENQVGQLFVGQARAEFPAECFAGGLLQVEGAQAQNKARAAVTELLDKTAGLPRNSRARRVGPSLRFQI